MAFSLLFYFIFLGAGKSNGHCREASADIVIGFYITFLVEQHYLTIECDSVTHGYHN